VIHIGLKSFRVFKLVNCGKVFGKGIVLRKREIDN
jgi:hypothetical protein